MIVHAQGSISRFSRFSRRIIFATLSLLAIGPAGATRPLFDQYSDGEHTGNIFPDKCCHLELPEDKRIRELRRQQIGNCSAAGGPVGVFRREDGKLWLTGLAECRGEIRLRRLYPDLEGPVVATWLSGTFTAHLDQCYGAGVQLKPAVTQTLVVEQGVVKSVVETLNDVSDCKR